jgi:murein DD-endopeptidase MepM/ murein hydrolase activator NlpD
VRATSLPTVLPVAAAAFALVAAVLAPLAVSSTALAERWLRPVPGEVARPFTYDRGAPFAAGAHRGADLAARPGTAVRAACSGRVVHAGAVAGSHPVVSVRCGGRRVSYLPLANVAVAAGAWIRAGKPIGTLAAGHGGVHVGVRREGDPFGYEDPMALLRAPGRPVPPAPWRTTPRATSPRPAAPRERAPQPAPRLAPRERAPQPAPRLAPRERAPRERAPQPAPRLAERPLARHAQPLSPAPWPVWAGLAVVLSGAAGSGTVALRRRRLARARVPLTAAAR